MADVTGRRIRAEEEQQLAIIFLLLSMIPPVVFSMQDLAFQAGLGRLMARTLPVVVSLVGIVMLVPLRSEHEVRGYTFAASLAMALALIVSTAARPDAELMPLRGRMLGPALMFLLMPNSFRRQILPPVLLSVAYTALRLWRVNDVGMLELTNDVLMLAVLNVGGILLVARRVSLETELDEISARERDARREAEAALARVRTLEGVIPVCSFCGSVRMDGGDWQGLQRYITQHSKATFSHGLCPPCRARHYPEFS